jgi:hypothetical protein
MSFKEVERILELAIRYHISSTSTGGHTEMSSILADQYSALVYEPKCGGMVGGCGVSANEYSCAHLAQINFGDLTPCTYLTYDS